MRECKLYKDCEYRLIWKVCCNDCHFSKPVERICKTCNHSYKHEPYMCRFAGRGLGGSDFCSEWEPDQS